MLGKHASVQFPHCHVEPILAAGSRAEGSAELLYADPTPDAIGSCNFDEGMQIFGIFEDSLCFRLPALVTMGGQTGRPEKRAKRAKS